MRRLAYPALPAARRNAAIPEVLFAIPPPRQKLTTPTFPLTGLIQQEVLDAAWDGGVRYFDAARSYGLGEKFLGNWLRRRVILPDSVTVGSKWGYTYTADWKIQAEVHEIKEHSLATLQRQWPETLASLDGYLKLYQIHSATTQSGVLENREVLLELARLKSDGVRIGLTASGPGQCETANFHRCFGSGRMLKPAFRRYRSERSHDSGSNAL